MKISEVFNLNKSQHELDFVDIDLSNELPLFLDSHIFSLRDDSWSNKCNLIVIDFFRSIHESITFNNESKMKELCSNLTEPNETCLGRSKGKPRGAFKSEESMAKIFEELFKIKQYDENQFNAIKVLSDMKFYINGVGNDTISDIVTSLIRRQLIIYTFNQCELHGIPTVKIVSKPYWNEISSQWEKEPSINQLIVNGEKILLVPKNIVFAEEHYSFTKERFVQHDLLNFLQQKELQTPNSALIRYRTPKKGQQIGNPYVTKKSIRERENIDKKHKVLEFSSKYPALIKNFKNQFRFESLNVLDLSKITDENISDEQYNDLIDTFILSLKSIPRGKKAADEYHNFIMGLITFIFHPSLSNPKKETPIDNKRKKIDITYINTADHGFFYNLKSEITSNYIYVECKNYSGPISNPEIDQLAGRFNESASKVGLMVCREVDEFAYERISGHYRRKKELILLITDELLISILDDMKITEKLDSNNHERHLQNLKRKIEVENY